MSGAAFCICTGIASITRRKERWMGWERKRGKLMDLNNLAAGHRDSFPGQGGRPFRAAADSLCDHPGLRHQAAAGNRSPAYRSFRRIR